MSVGCSGMAGGAEQRAISFAQLPPAQRVIRHYYDLEDRNAVFDSSRISLRRTIPPTYMIRRHFF